MDQPPTPKPRTFVNNYENVKRPIPRPRKFETLGGTTSSTKDNDEIILRNKPQGTNSNNIEREPSVSKSVPHKQQSHNKILNSVLEGKKSLNNSFLNISKKRHKGKNVLTVPQQERCVSMPATDTKLFDSIQFNSPINEQIQYDVVRCSNNTSIQSFSSESITDSSKTSETDINSTLSMAAKENLSMSSDSSFSGGLTMENDQIDSKECVPHHSNSWALYDTVASDDSTSTGDINKVHLRKNNGDKLNKNVRPSQSVMIEFDPLSKRKTSSTPLGNLANLSLLEMLYEDNTSTDTDTDLDFYVNNSVEYLSPPTPPERLDSLFLIQNSLPEEKKKEDKNKSQDQQSKWFINNDNTDVDASGSQSEINKQLNIASRFSNMFKMVPESASYFKKMIESGGNNAIPSELLLQNNTSRHQGKMVRFLPGGIEEMLKKYAMKPCSLADYKLVFYQENSNVKDVYNMKNFYSVQIILSHKFNYDGELHCFQINFSTLGTFNLNRGSVIFGCENETERNYWIRMIIESYSTRFPISFVTNLTRFGWCHLKEGVSGSWNAAWILLSKRKLFYYTSQDDNVKNVDLRKARCVVLKESNEKKTGDSGCHILLDQQDVTLYLKMGANRETKMWHRILKAVATNNGSSIHHQQLTKDDIPTIVDKCINFIYTQGSLSVGIYRKAGSSGLVSQLLADFRADAWAVQLASRTHSEHDVATALKRFFRDLPDSLLTSELHPMFCAITGISNKEDKVKKYKSLIGKMDHISQNTLRKLIGHLHFIQSLAEENCMSSFNLATVWGPTLLSTSKADRGNMLQEETKVIYDLIDLYMLIYEPSKLDIEKEQKMLSVLKQCQKVTNPIQKRSGDLHVWIYLFEKSAGNSVNVVLTPGRTSGDVCLELCNKVKTDYHLLMIEEVICGDSMRRPLHHNEMLLDVVLRWGYWDEKDRCDNYLVLQNNALLLDAASTVSHKLPASLSMELRFANEKMKSFSLCTAEFAKGKLTISKDKVGNQFGSWNMGDLRWYLGHETKRNPQSKWSITFIEKNKALRSRDKPWFGFTIAGTLKEEQLSWIGLLLQAEHKNDLIPEPKFVVT